MKRTLLTALAALTLTALPLSVVRADETVGEKVDSSARHATTSTKEAGRDLQDKMCDKGDAKCAAQKAKNKMHTGADKTKDAAKDAKNKVD